MIKKVPIIILVLLTVLILTTIASANPPNPPESPNNPPECNETNGGIEICDGIDNDCDWEIDEGLTTQNSGELGICAANTETCTAGSWILNNETLPTTETCNSQDDNCDGETDEGCNCTNGQTQACGYSATGNCVLGTQTCTAGVWGTCNGATYPIEEVCDGEDNNCDGEIDENITREKTCGVGICSGNIGIETCSNNSWINNTCNAVFGATTEICDGNDNDCDGVTDENCQSTSSCFPAGTQITLADKTQTPIENVKVGDYILSFNGEKQISAKVLELESPIRNHLNTIIFADGTRLQLTNEHPLLTDQGWKSIKPEETKKENNELNVKKLSITDSVLNSKGLYVPINKITYEEKIIQTYNLKTIEQTKTFYANGYLAHNKGGGGLPPPPDPDPEEVNQTNNISFPDSFLKTPDNTINEEANNQEVELTNNHQEEETQEINKQEEPRFEQTKPISKKNIFSITIIGVITVLAGLLVFRHQEKKQELKYKEVREYKRQQETAETPEEKVRHYIKACRDKSISDQEIKNKLRTVGWKPEFIEKAFKPK